MSGQYLIDLVRKRYQGIKMGICSVCSAHPYVLEASFEQGLEDGLPVLIESTSNQVNQFGGYTGMTPESFRAFVCSLADKIRFPRERLILGGDHLGPFPWRKEEGPLAMDKGCRMVAQYVEAGYHKIHLDASMHLGGDTRDRHRPLSPELAAMRSALLCRAAEEAYQKCKEKRLQQAAPVYVIGTEVPVPGGVAVEEEAPEVTRVADLEITIDTTRKSFRSLGLDAAWERVIAVVVQPGVEFGDRKIFSYDREKTKELVAALVRHPNLVYEGHSTDYQEASDLRRMVEDGIAILKVGPALTFAMREALFLLSSIEEELLGDSNGEALSDLPQVLERAMVANPEYWQAYYRGSERDLKLARKFSLSDRCRYYWSESEVGNAVSKLLHNLEAHPAPLTLISQFFPVQYWKIRRGELPNKPEALIKDRIKAVLRDYSYAVNSDMSNPPGDTETSTFEKDSL